MEWLILFFLGMALLHAYLFKKIAKGLQASSNPTTNPTEPLSIIIAARNEAHQIEKCLDAILKNEYTEDWEIIVVNDRSEDNTESILERLEKSHPRLRHLSIRDCPENFPPKKYALTQGIQAAKYECLLFTDADCLVPENWIQEMAKRFSPRTKVILGSGPYQRKSGFLNALIQFETLQTAFLYLGMAGNQSPYMSVGRNLAYRKSFFETVGGFNSGIQSLSGDDDLLINHHAPGNATAIILSVPVISAPPIRWSIWFRQKLRHLSAGKFYRPGTMFLPGLFQFSWLMALLSGLVISTYEPFPLLLILWIFALVRLGIMNSLTKFKGVLTREFVLLPLLELLFVLYQLIIAPAGMILKPKWTSSHPHPPEQKKTAF
jgi:poly-beta-1,6-N-acetyl-D-glucosamine synthase